jgi:hypothetical protein
VLLLLRLLQLSSAIAIAFWLLLKLGWRLLKLDWLFLKLGLFVFFLLEL